MRDREIIELYERVNNSENGKLSQHEIQWLINQAKKVREIQLKLDKANQTIALKNDRIYRMERRRKPK